MAEINKAKLFRPALKHLTIATSAPNEAKLQEFARITSLQHRQEGIFDIDVMGWCEISARLKKHPPLLKRHYGSILHMFELIPSMAEEPDNPLRDSLVRMNRPFLSTLSSTATNNAPHKATIELPETSRTFSAIDLALDDVNIFCNLISSSAQQLIARLSNSRIRAIINNSELIIAFEMYRGAVLRYKSLLAFGEPGHHRHGGILLFALSSRQPITELVLQDDGASIDHRIELLLQYPNEILAFDFAYRYCAMYEEEIKEIRFDYLVDMCWSLRHRHISENGAFMVLKSLLM